MVRLLTFKVSTAVSSDCELMASWLQLMCWEVHLICQQVQQWFLLLILLLIQPFTLYWHGSQQLRKWQAHVLSCPRYLCVVNIMCGSSVNLPREMSGGLRCLAD